MSKYTVRLSDDEQDDWESFVDDSPQFNTKSQLVRASVEEKIQREKDKEDGDLTKEQKEIITEMRSEFDRTYNKLEKIIELSESIKELQINPDQLRDETMETLVEFESNKDTILQEDESQ